MHVRGWGSAQLMTKRKLPGAAATAPRAKANVVDDDGNGFSEANKSGQGPILLQPGATPVEAALTYAAAGIPVFPCNPKNKRPLTRHGFKDATTDPNKIMRPPAWRVSYCLAPSLFSFTDEELAIVFNAAKSVPWFRRSLFLRHVVATLQQVDELGPGTLYRTVREVQGKYLWTGWPDL
jgi:hypothetical protein